MVAPFPASRSSGCILLVFNPGNQLAVRTIAGEYAPAFDGLDQPTATAQVEGVFKTHTAITSYFFVNQPDVDYEVFFTQVDSAPSDPTVKFISLEKLFAPQAALSPLLKAVLAELDPFLMDIPYLHLGENDFIYKFRVEKDRNRRIYDLDATTRSLYQSKLCEALKLLTRKHERTATKPAMLDFGAVHYIIPSHFGFCLGVKNAIERAYETLAENPDRRVFMLSELIHNPFVNEDLLRRGLRYLQTDKGLSYGIDGQIVAPGETKITLWDTLTCQDIVIIPAFGATDEDKCRLVLKGIRVAHYDATCMLVEKVWKAARAFGREGYTVIIHGKSEHEETKATFSNTRRYAPALIIRDLAEAKILGALILDASAENRAAFAKQFSGLTTPDFNADLYLERLAVVNQTTLLMNETLSIIDYLKSVYSQKYGSEQADVRVGGGGKRDTLCYATQVNQDALSRALDEPLDAAFVIGGKNSSNTYQLYRLCAQRLAAKACFIQSEANVKAHDAIEHYVFPAKGPGGGGGHTERRTLTLPDSGTPLRVLITGGASCPDGIIQQVITRINGFFPANELCTLDEVLDQLQPDQ